MICRFISENYSAQLASLAASEQSIQTIEICIKDRLVGFEASSRSIPMLCHSIKMGMPLKVGGKLESAGHLSDELNPLVAGYYYKVGSLVISYTNAKGKLVSIRHRPDTLRLFTLPDSVPIEGFKTEKFIRFGEYKCWDTLEKLAKENDQYVFDKDLGRFRSPCSEQAALNTFGFGYDVLTERDVDAVVVSNFEVLHTYFEKRAKSVPYAISDQVREVTAKKQGISLAELMASAPGLNADHFYKLIADQKVYVPLEICHLEYPSTVHVFTDRLSYEAFGALTPSTPPTRYQIRNRFPTFDPGEIVTIRGKNYTVVAPSEFGVQFRDESGESCSMKTSDLKQFLKDRQISSLGVPANREEAARKILLSTSPETLSSALNRYEIIRPILDGNKKRSCLPKNLRNAKEWLRRARLANINYQNPLIGCIDDRSSQGWHGSHISEASEALIREAIDTKFMSIMAPKKAAAYGFYRELCKERGQSPVSDKTFNVRIGRYAADKLAKAREGEMAGAALEAPVAEETLLSGAGRWFMHIAGLDEFTYDLALIFPELGIPIGTAWASAMIDTFTRTALAVIVSFEAPSYVTTMMLLRECVRRWGRLPEVLLMDNGAGYKNISLVLFAKRYRIKLMCRPSGRPRWGSENERWGGDTNQRIANELPGSTKILAKYRRVSKTHHPDTLAVYGIKGATEIITEWAYNIFDNLPHRGLHGKTPKTAREISLVEHGLREHLKISDDPEFDIYSLPAPKGDGTCKVQAHEGVQVFNLCYWHRNSFSDPEIVGTYVDVRWLPFDITRVYAFVGREWVQCDCVKLLKLRKLSQEQLCAVSLHIRKGRSDYNRNHAKVLEQVAEFLTPKQTTGAEFVENLRTRASAQQFINASKPIDMGDDEAGATPKGGDSPRPKIPGFTATAPKQN